MNISISLLIRSSIVLQRQHLTRQRLFRVGLGSVTFPVRLVLS